jgi:hypothetical protein
MKLQKIANYENPSNKRKLNLSMQRVAKAYVGTSLFHVHIFMMVGEYLEWQ